MKNVASLVLTLLFWLVPFSSAEPFARWDFGQTVGGRVMDRAGTAHGTLQGNVSARQIFCAATLAELRQIEPAVRAVVMSGYSNDQTLQQWKREGFVGALPKPFDNAMLKKVLKEALGEHGTCLFQYQRVREYWDKSDVDLSLIRNREVGVETVANCARLARISCFRNNRIRHKTITTAVP